MLSRMTRLRKAEIRIFVRAEAILQLQYCSMSPIPQSIFFFEVEDKPLFAGISTNQ